MYKPLWPDVDTADAWSGGVGFDHGEKGVVFVAPMGRKKDKKKPTRKRVVRSVLVAVTFETISVWLRSGKLGGNLVVRCRDGHLFTTLWIPAVSVKALRLGPWRVQRCPVGHHWSIVTPVKEAQLTPEQLETARAHHDRRVP